MLTDQAKEKLNQVLQPLYADPDFANVISPFHLTVVSTPIVVTPPADDTENLDIIKP